MTKSRKQADTRPVTTRSIVASRQFARGFNEGRKGCASQEGRSGIAAQNRRTLAYLARQLVQFALVRWRFHIKSFRENAASASLRAFG